MTEPANPTPSPKTDPTESPPIPEAEELSLTERPWLRRGMIFLFLLALFAPPFIYEGDEYRLPQFTKYASLAILALGVDLIWGYTGLLSLGQGLYFGLGAYALAYSLKLQHAARLAGRPPIISADMALPDFMGTARLPAVPLWVAPLINIWVALAVAVLLPALVAMLFGLVTFRLRIKGVYFSLVTQALLLAFFMVVVDQLPYTNGDVGILNLPRLELFGHAIPKPPDVRGLDAIRSEEQLREFKAAEHEARIQADLDMYVLIGAILVICFLSCYALVHSKVGKILTAIRDNENRVQALGYNPVIYKTFIFALAGALSGLSGALYVASNRSAGPDFLRIDFSIIAVILVAVGGRGTLVGAILGTFLVRFGETRINELWPKYWQIILGSLFIAVVLFLPEGVVGLLRKIEKRLKW